MLFMVIERFRDGNARPVYERFRDRGRMAPDGLKYVASWVDTKLACCYQVMETDDRTLLTQWVANWSDLTDFELIPVMTSQQAAAKALGEPPGPAPVTFEGVTPVFRVENIDASLKYYLDVLGFTLDFREPQSFASVSRGKANIFLAEGDQGQPGTWVWIGVSDVERLFKEYLRNGATIRQPPTNFVWACEMQIEDPDGHILRFGSDPKPGVPFGPWMDMNGDCWSRDADGRWIVEKRKQD
jgi:uncharacterized glyoxalase superfamily protein PhnB